MMQQLPFFPGHMQIFQPVDLKFYLNFGISAASNPQTNLRKRFKARSNPQWNDFRNGFHLRWLRSLCWLASEWDFHGQAQKQNQTRGPARSRSEEMLDRWNDIGNKLVAMAKDFPEDKYDFKVQKDQRTFALNLLHAAALDFVLIRRVSGTNVDLISAREIILRATLSRPRPM